MSLSEIIIAIAIHLLVPLLGIVAFLLLCHRMKRAQIPSPPFFPYFILFGTLGGWLLVLLTALFWQWSGMASIGVFSRVLAAPVLTALLALSLRSYRTLSTYHYIAYTTSIGYTSLIFVTILCWIGIQLFVK